MTKLSVNINKVATLRNARGRIKQQFSEMVCSVALRIFQSRMRGIYQHGA